MEKLVEIKIYRLKKGEEGEFHRIMSEESLPLHEKAGIEVVAHGPCAMDGQGYFLIRSFGNQENLRRSQAGLYASIAWREGPRTSIVERIESDAGAVFFLPEAAIEWLRQAKPSA